MTQILDLLSELLNGPGPGFVWVGLGSGVLMLFMGLLSLTRGRDPVSRRLIENSTTRSHTGGKDRLVRPKASMPTGLMRGVVPTDEKQHSSIRRHLQECGFHHKNAVAIYFVLRTVFGLLLPGILGFALLLQSMLVLPSDVQALFPEFSHQQILFVIGGLIILGFYGPSFYVTKRIEKRRLEITEGFPNALDLMQISAEAGLGFDAAMSRVAGEIARSGPVISQEFQMAQMEVSAGRDRESALMDMADRMGVPEVTSFVGVILQSMQFGTSVSDALTAYAQDMRVQRELKAQEKANKLPVQMSGVLVAFMLPALLILVFTPLAVRFIRILVPALSQMV